MDKISSSEITPEHLYLSRRKFLLSTAALTAGALLFGSCKVNTDIPVTDSPETKVSGFCSSVKVSGNTDELGDKLTDCQSVISYNNFYEFSLFKDDPAELARNFRVEPWTIQVGGEVTKPATYSIDDLIQKFQPEERIYRMRCVEAWSMVIPWLGFSLSKLLNEVEPTSKARYVRFETIYDPDQMPGQHDKMFNWPYIEGLRLDEAMHRLTILATGLYGKPMPPQNGAPVRLVVPWKYGFKSIKSIVKIDLVEEMPISLWMAQSPNEYGFYANVNPEVSHPRWSQASETRIGENGRRKTLMFNGYADDVAQLYAGMDLKKFY